MTTERTPRQQLVRDLLLLIALPALVITTCIRALTGPLQAKSRYSLAEGEDLFALTAGVWDWNGENHTCNGPHRIAFDSAHRIMTITQSLPWTDTAGVPRQTSVYDISVVDGVIRGKIRGETRRTEAGDTVVWDLVLTSPDSYHWRRTDWARDAGTAEIERCEAAAVTDSMRRLFAEAGRAESLYHAVAGELTTLKVQPTRLWAVVEDPDHYLAADLSPLKNLRVDLIVARGPAPYNAFFSRSFPRADHIILDTWHRGGRTLVIMESMEGPRSQGTMLYEIRNDSLVDLNLMRLAKDSSGEAVSILEDLTVDTVGHYFRLRFTGDPIGEPGTDNETRLCRILPFGEVLFDESETGWHAASARKRPSCGR